MAFTIKDATIPNKCITCVVVDDDLSTIVDVVTTDTGTTGAGASVSSASWDGTTRGYVSIPSTGSTCYIDMGTAMATASWSGGGAITIVALIEDWNPTVSSSAGRALVAENGAGGFSIIKEAYQGARCTVKDQYAGYYTNTALPESGQYLYAWVIKSGQLGPVYYGAAGASSVTENTDTVISAAGIPASGSFSVSKIGNTETPGTNSLDGKLYAYMVFNQALTSGELDTLVADPWGTMFAGGASVAPLAMVNFARMHNG